MHILLLTCYELLERSSYSIFTYTQSRINLRFAEVHCLHVVDVTGYGIRSQYVYLKEVAEANFGNAIVRPMSGTLHDLPWVDQGKHSIGEVLCETSWMPPYRDGAPQAACTRYMARTQLDLLSALGYQLMSGYEAEFFMYHKDGVGDVTSRPVFLRDDHYSSANMTEHTELVCWMVDCLCAAGVNVESTHTVTAPGQLEIATGPEFGIKSTDNMFIIKDAVKEIGILRGLHATFMTKPVVAHDASQLHFNHSLWVGDSNVFHDPEKASRGLSTLGRRWIAGLLTHAAALSALCRPTVNCYRGLVEPLLASKSNWGFEDRKTMLRIVTSSAGKTYVENRLPNGPANPYVVLAATVAAGIDGLVNCLEPPSDTQDHSEPLPSSLSQAVSALEADKVLCDALGEEFVRWFSTVKREVEIEAVNKAREKGRDEMEVERELYFTRL